MPGICLRQPHAHLALQPPSRNRRCEQKYRPIPRRRRRVDARRRISATARTRPSHTVDCALPSAGRAVVPDEGDVDALLWPPAEVPAQIFLFLGKNIDAVARAGGEMLDYFRAVVDCD